MATSTFTEIDNNLSKNFLCNENESSISSAAVTVLEPKLSVTTISQSACDLPRAPPLATVSKHKIPQLLRTNSVSSTELYRQLKKDNFIPTVSMEEIKNIDSQGTMSCEKNIPLPKSNEREVSKKNSSIEQSRPSTDSETSRQVRGADTVEKRKNDKVKSDFKRSLGLVRQQRNVRSLSSLDMLRETTLDATGTQIILSELTDEQKDQWRRVGSDNLSLSQRKNLNLLLKKTGKSRMRNQALKFLNSNSKALPFNRGNLTYTLYFLIVKLCPVGNEVEVMGPVFVTDVLNVLLSSVPFDLLTVVYEYVFSIRKQLIDKASPNSTKRILSIKEIMDSKKVSMKIFDLVNDWVIENLVTKEKAEILKRANKLFPLEGLCQKLITNRPVIVNLVKKLEESQSKRMCVDSLHSMVTFLQNYGESNAIRTSTDRLKLFSNIKRISAFMQYIHKQEHSNKRQAGSNGSSTSLVPESLSSTHAGRQSQPAKVENLKEKHRSTLAKHRAITPRFPKEKSVADIFFPVMAKKNGSMKRKPSTKAKGQSSPTKKMKRSFPISTTTNSEKMQQSVPSSHKKSDNEKPIEFAKASVIDKFETSIMGSGEIDFVKKDADHIEEIVSSSSSDESSDDDEQTD